jgi:hypothetical protein
MQDLIVLKNGEVQNESVGKVFCKSETFELTAGQTIGAGTVLVSNDLENLYVTYQASNGWKIQEVHLYVGTKEGVPVNPQNVPVPGQFPINESFNPEVETVSFEIPLADLPECPYIAAHAVVVKEGGSETAWGNGNLTFEDEFGIKRWGFLINYCPEECEGKDFVFAAKVYVVDNATYSENNTERVWWVVSKSDNSVDDCLGIGFNTFNTNQQGEVSYDLIKNGDINDKAGTISTLITEENGTKYLNVELHLDVEGFSFSQSFLYVGSEVGLGKTSIDFGGFEHCYLFEDWFYKVTDFSDTHNYKIPIADIE